MLTLPKDANAAGLEEFLREVQQSPGQDIRLPIHTSRGGVSGFGVAALQAIATWARIHDGIRTIHLPPNFASDESTKERFASSLQGMAALYFCDSVRAGSDSFKRSTALAAVAPRVAAMSSMDFRNTARGRVANLCCFEGAKAEFLPSLYSKPWRGTQNETTVRSTSDLKRVLLQLVDACAPEVALRITQGQAEVIGNLVHQLFKNADVHTVTDGIGNLSSSGMRGIQVRYLNIDSPEAVAEFTADDVALHTYIAKVRHISAGEQRRANPLLVRPGRSTAFLEISVFDSGPGLALKWLSEKQGVTTYRDMSLENELEAIRQCFQLHATTHTGSTRGDGLEVAMLAMKQLQAFMILRTGRLALVQDFSTGEHKGFLPRNRYGSRRKLAAVAGATYTICFPVNA